MLSYEIRNGHILLMQIPPLFIEMIFTNCWLFVCKKIAKNTKIFIKIFSKYERLRNRFWWFCNEWTFFLKEIREKNSLEHNQNLQSFIIKPVQRITRYRLMLEQLLKNCKNNVEEIKVSRELIIYRIVFCHWFISNSVFVVLSRWASREAFHCLSIHIFLSRHLRYQFEWNFHSAF